MFSKISFDFDAVYDSGTHSRRHVTLPLLLYKSKEGQLAMKASIQKALEAERFKAFEEEPFSEITEVSISCTLIPSDPTLVLSIPVFDLIDGEDWHISGNTALDEWLNKILDLPPSSGSAS